jgi:hypothetical protein
MPLLQPFDRLVTRVFFTFLVAGRVTSTPLSKQIARRLGQPSNPQKIIFISLLRGRLEFGQAVMDIFKHERGEP